MYVELVRIADAGVRAGQCDFIYDCLYLLDIGTSGTPLRKPVVIGVSVINW